jgi:hypothetical protein
MADFNEVKCTFRFVSDNGDRWSEVWYRSESAIYKDAQPPHLVAYMDKRLPFLTTDKRLHSVRVSPAFKTPTTGKRLSKSYRLLSPRGQDDSKGTMANYVVVVPVLSTTGHSREFPLHGLRASWFSLAADGTSLASLSTTAKAFFQYLKDDGWHIKTLTAGPQDAAGKTIEGLTIVGGALQLVATLGVAAAPGSKIIVSGVKGYKTSQFNGTWRVQSYDAGGPLLIATSKRFLDPNFFWDKTTGTVRVVQDSLYNFDTLDSWGTTNLETSSHKTGNPFDARRGRQSARR